MLLLHIGIALGSILFTGFMYMKPTKTKLQLSYGLVSLTLITGTYLVMSASGHLVEACFSGLMYLAIVFVAIGATKQKLARYSEKA